MTVPVGVPVADDVTVAVKVTAWPKAEGFSEEINVVADGEPGGPHDVNFRDAMRVFQLNEPFVVRYSLVYQKVQSSTGSMLILL